MTNASSLRPRRLALAFALAALLAAPATHGAILRPPLPQPPGGGAAARPNIVVLMTDDQTFESLRVMPNVDRLIADQGVTFESFFATYSLCCPSRSTFLTGQYAHNHGVLGNFPPDGGYGALDHRNTLPVWLQRAGYSTALVGKYLNGYGGSRKRTVPPGYTEWHGLVDPSTYRYWNFTISENGEPTKFRRKPGNYQTDVLADRAVALVRDFAGSRKPFFLWVAFMAPHSDITSPQKLAVPAPRHQGDLAGEELSGAPSINEADVSDKPAHIRDLPLLTEDELGEAELQYERRLEALLAVDEAVARIVAELKKTGELSNTVIVFVSDNGYLLGEHRLPEGKVLPYEESIRLPLIVRGPGFAKGATASAFAANIDLAPTIAELARATPKRTMDGISLVPVLEDPATSWQRDFVIESGPNPESEDVEESDHAEESFVGVRTDRYLYVEYGSGDLELYDLVADPYQLESRHADASFASVLAGLAGLLDDLESCAGSACR